jgi:hypothetical protein
MVVKVSEKLDFKEFKMQRSMNFTQIESQRMELFSMSPSQLAQKELKESNIDMAAIHRIRTMGSR